ncbi:DUF4192 domain-containing protein [Cryptosporangium minutisporangium]|uniref:DUF4192 domain-containing protein n=1 Tax=Cryptosporangium minutisporangium TaxID=113569 RepID=A0ABP6SVY7_9ACTN
MTPPKARLRITSDLDLVALVPYVLRYHPQESMVALVVDDDRLTVTTRSDLPPTAEECAGPDYRRAVRTVIAQIAEDASMALLVGYGPADRVEPATALYTDALTAAGLLVGRALRVNDGRFYCLKAGCTQCPAEGTPYDPAASPLPAAATYQGMVALPDRDAVANLVAPVTGPARARMTVASQAAQDRLTALLPSLAPGQTAPLIMPAAVLTAGYAAVDAALQAAADGRTLSDDDAAWLIKVLTIMRIRDHAWAACDGSPTQRELWADLTRRAEPHLTAAPASLLALTAYLGGDGPLARVALDCALRADPSYRMARLLTSTLDAAVPPDVLRQINAAAHQSQRNEP